MQASGILDPKKGHVRSIENWYILIIIKNKIKTL